MKDVQKIKEFFSKPLKETKEEDVLGDWISDMLKYKSYEEVKKIVAKSLRDALLDDELVAKIKKEKSDLVFFSAKEASRKELYKTMAPLIASKLGMKQVNNGTYYFLYKD